MEHVRLTFTKVSNDTEQESLNTITVSPALVNEPHKFLLLVQKIAGTNFLKVPYE